MSEYLTYTLWRNREERMPHELERRRVAQERFEQDQEQLGRERIEEQAHEQFLVGHRPTAEPTGALETLPESAGPSTASAGASDASLVPTAASPVSSEATAELEHQLVER